MVEEGDYEALGLKVGVEIHQQILTEKKMFCRCPARHYVTSHDGVVLRHMRPTLSELGEYDGTALMEFKTKKDVVYLLNNECVCTYEMDDTPPFPVNQQGLDIAIEVALLLQCNIVDEMHVARKQYLDGSIPTGFQRTAVVGVGGSIPYKNRQIRIIQLCYEEDACREVSDTGHTITFRTDRLGMPLVEVITCADMHTPHEAAEVVERIGRLMRATGKVRRGIGSVRQDVNVSITGGDRVELKGVPKFGWIPKLVHNEALRQKALLDLREKLKERGITTESFQAQHKDITSQMQAADGAVFRNALRESRRIGAVVLRGWAGFLATPMQPGTTFADEIAGRVRVIACLDVMPNIYTSDTYPEYHGAAGDLQHLRAAAGACDGDCVVVTWGPERDVKTAMEEIEIRAREATAGVPRETRQPFASGITDFERILPGPNRMYPDTDSPPTKITEERVRRIKAALPDKPWDREALYRQRGVRQHVARELAISLYAPLFEKAITQMKLNPVLIAHTLVERLKAMRREGLAVANLTPRRLEQAFEPLASGRILPGALPLLLRELAESPGLTVDKVLENGELEPASESEIEMEVEAALKLDFEGDIKKRLDYLTGQVARNLPGRVNGAEVCQMIAARLDKDTRR